MSAINIDHLSFGYTTDTLAIDDLTLTINEGEYTVLIGPNGSGKSTLAKLFIGLLEPRNGTIAVFDQQLRYDTVDAIRSKIGIVFQNPDNQFIGSTVEDDIAFGLENREIDPSQMQSIIMDYASRVGMIDYLKTEPTRLSGGQKQRVAIAGVMAMQPKIMVFDEATSMLDPKGRYEITRLMHDLKSNTDMTIISITHDMEEIAAADRCIVLKDGHLFYDGKPQPLLDDPTKMAAASLQIPFAMRMRELLHQQGIDTLSHTMEGMVDELCRLHSVM